MNERIRELAIKSGLDFDGFGYPIWGSCEDEKKEFLEKFAELIIKKCAARADVAVDNHCECIGGNVLAYFGVEE
jgi:hypothetical protein